MLIGRDPGPDGAHGRSEPGALLPRDPNDPRLWLPGQGRANACGTTTLAYVLRYLLGSDAPPREAIDDEIRRGNIFSAPMLLVGYARRLGLAARAYDGASAELLFDLVDREVPTMVLTDTTPLNLRDTANLHWVAVVAHCGDRVGIYNPHGFQEELDLTSFAAHWREARIFGLPAWSRLAIAIARDPNDLPPAGRPGLALVGANLAAAGVAGVVNGALGARAAVGRGKPLAAGLRAVPEGVGVVMAAAETLVGGVFLLAGAAAERIGLKSKTE